MFSSCSLAEKYIIVTTIRMQFLTRVYHIYIFIPKAVLLNVLQTICVVCHCHRKYRFTWNSIFSQRYLLKKDVGWQLEGPFIWSNWISLEARVKDSKGQTAHAHSLSTKSNVQCEYAALASNVQFVARIMHAIYNFDSFKVKFWSW
jgi:hypothetical protein